MNIEKEFPARYWINLGRRQDRRVEMEYQLELAGIRAERFPAVDARFVKRNRGYESAGRYALALSQRLAIRKAMLEGAEAVLVMEDDVVFHPELVQRLEEIVLPEDWGIFYLGCAHRWPPKAVSDGLVKVRYALDTHAFAVRTPYYKRVMAALSLRGDEAADHPLASDWFLADLHGEISTYACFPNLAWQAATNSDLAGGVYSNYTENGEQKWGGEELHGVQAAAWGGTRWSGWKRPASEVTDPKMGLLFLTRGEVNQPRIWREFTADAGDEVKVFCHAKDREEIVGGFLDGTQIEDWHETQWGDISLVRAMLALLKTAMRDETLTHFAFLSEGCIPIRPWAEMRRRLKLDPRSMMPIKKADEMKPQQRARLDAVRNLSVREMRLHPQWIVLNREAAECVTEDDFTERFSEIFAPDEHYFGTVLAMRGYPIADRVNPTTPTWVEWTGSLRCQRPVIHCETSSRLAAELAARPGFFARKFDPSSDIGKWGLHRS